MVSLTCASPMEDVVNNGGTYNEEEETVRAAQEKNEGRLERGVLGFTRPFSWPHFPVAANPSPSNRHHHESATHLFLR